ncbi:MAG: glycerol kinase GlpK [Clostridiales bacterium]|nr:glycerol kinase GlpK [Clostridiales bacterium]
MKKYMLGIDQSTQGTKGIVFDGEGRIVARTDLAHDQIVNEKGWVEHNPDQIMANVIQVLKNVVDQAGINKSEILGLGISNQRETAICWNRRTGRPVYNAIVWQCARGEAICEQIEKDGYAGMIQQHTGIPLSPYYSAAKIAWVLQNVEEAKEAARQGELAVGTMDSYLVYQLTKEHVFKTDYSNASRTQMFHIEKLDWDDEVIALFGIQRGMLAEVCDSDALYGYTDLDGWLDEPIPIHGVMGDSHGALFGQGCVNPGMIKATYGTGSSIMMNVGEKPIYSDKGVVSSLAWSLGGKVNYVLEGNINYTGAVITWLQKDLGLIASAGETQKLAEEANPGDTTYLVPAFTGLGAPYWDSNAKAIVCGITRTTGKAEVVRAALDCIVYQISDVVHAMAEDAGLAIEELRVDGGPTKNGYLMQFQSDILDITVQVPDAEELSAMGPAYAAGIAMGFYEQEKLFAGLHRTRFTPEMDEATRNAKYAGWKESVEMVLTK